MIAYLSAMSVATHLLDRALITEKEFYAFETRMREKYHIPANSIYRDFHLISIQPRGSIRNKQR